MDTFDRESAEREQTLLDLNLPPEIHEIFVQMITAAESLIGVPYSIDNEIFTALGKSIKKMGLLRVQPPPPPPTSPAPNQTEKQNQVIDITGFYWEQVEEDEKEIAMV